MRWFRLPVLALALFACGEGGGLGVFQRENPPGLIEQERGAPLKFDEACVEGTSITVAAVGDIIFYGTNQEQALDEGLGYRSHWEGLVEFLSSADITYGNFEGVTACCVNPENEEVDDPGVAFDRAAYTSHPTYNYHASLVDDLVASGFDVVSTANNHAMDRKVEGADQTIAALRKADLPFTGTRRSDEEEADWHTITEAKGIRVAWLACTTSTNKREDEEGQVLRCNTNRRRVIEIVGDLAERDDVDAVIVTPHTGVQWSPKPTKWIREFTADVVKAGAIAVLANHPHTIQTWNRYRMEDGRDALGFYALANFVQSSVVAEKRASVVLLLGLTKDDDGVTHLNGVRFVPIAMQHGDILTQKVLQPGDDPRARSIPLSRLSWWNVEDATSLVTNPQCAPDWKAPPKFRGFVGDGCDRDANCEEGLTCVTEWRDGFCSAGCDEDSDCPEDAVRGRSVCLEHEGTKRCVPGCERNADCRIEYVCGGEEDRGGCVPAPPEEE